jgi:hypothetical protein
MDRLERSELARRVLDLGRMRRLAEQLASAGDRPSHDRNEYELVLQGGLMVGRYLRWFEAGG